MMANSILEMKILEVKTDVKPDHCIDCMFISLRSDTDKYPQICFLTGEDILETEGELPKGCPIKCDFCS